METFSSLAWALETFVKMPDETRADSKLYGVELDSISGRIAKLLYPEDNIQIKGFEKQHSRITALTWS